MDTKDLIFKIEKLSGEDKKTEAKKFQKKIMSKASEYTKRIVDDKLNKRLGEC